MQSKNLVEEFDSREVALEPLYTPVEFEAAYKIPVATLAQWRHRGIGPKPTRLPGSRLVRYSASAISEWLKEGQDNV